MERTATETAAIHQAAAELGVAVDDVAPVSQGRTGVYRVTVHTTAAREGFPPGGSIQAARVTTLTDSITPAVQTHRLVHDLHQRGTPVAGPRHPDSVTTACGEVGFWEWLAETSVTPRQWGALTGAFHQAGRPPGRPGRRAGRQAGLAGAYDPARVFLSRVRRARELTGERGHPLHGAHALVRAFVDALEAAVREAAAASARSDQLLVLGDNQPGNVMAAATPNHGGAGRAVFNDFERIATGPPALDLAAVVLGVQHFGYPPVAAEQFRAGYAAGSGSEPPTLRQARPFARIRELSGAVIAMIQAGDSPQMEREMHVRAVAIAEPGAGERWTYVGDRGGRDRAHVQR